MAKKKTFSKLRNHLTSTELDEKAAVLENITRMPTNNTAFVFSGDPSNPQGNSFETIVDGETDETDYNVGESPTSSTEARDTTGLFNAGGDHAAGEYVKTVEPPGDTSYVLGPMAAMYYTWSYPWTMIGYIRESDRRMVNLGRIDGKLSDWDGSSGNASSGSGTFYSYGQLTTEQAIWFRDIKKAFGNTNDPATYSYRAFYPGPPSATPDAYGRYPCILTGISKVKPNTHPDSTPLDKQAGDNFSAQNARNKGLAGLLDKLTGSIGDRIKQGLQLGLNIGRGILDNINFAGDFMFKGLPQGVDYLPDFTGAGPKWLGGGKITDLPILKQLLGRDVQYFTPDLDTSLKWAGQNGSVVAVPRTNGVRGWKNWLGSNVSRGFDPTKGVEQIVKTSDTVAARNLTQVIKLSDPGAKTTLQNLAKKGASNNKVLSKLGKAIPFLNAGLVAADVTNRISKGDYAGALLGATQIIPGPIGWIGLASQVTYDVTGAKNNIPWNRQVGESMGDEMDNGGLGQALIDLGLPDNKEDFAKEIGFYYSLNEGISPELLSMLLLAITGQEMSEEQKNWIKDNIPNLTKGLADRITKLKSGEEEEDEVKEGLSLERKREIFGHLTQPIVLPETKQKTYKVSPGQRYKNKNKKPEETNFQDMDKLFNKNIGGPQPFKPQERTSWTKDFIAQNVMKSQEKMNGVLEMIGDGKHAFEYAMNDYKKMGAKELEQYWGKNPNMYSFMFNGKKYNVTRKEHVEGDLVVFMEDQKGVKSNMLQSELNLKLQEQNEKWIEEAYFKCHPVIPEKKESTYELIKRRFLENKKIAPEFPAEPPPKMINGFHPEYGKKANRYKKLDPASANAMPLTGDPETDEIVRKQKTINKIKSMKKK